MLYAPLLYVSRGTMPDSRGYAARIGLNRAQFWSHRHSPSHAAEKMMRYILTMEFDSAPDAMSFSHTGGPNWLPTKVVIEHAAGISWSWQEIGGGGAGAGGASPYIGPPSGGGTGPRTTTQD